MKQQREVVRQLLDAGADVKRKGAFGQSAIHWAAQSGDVGIVEMIVQAGADPLALCDREKNALWYLWSADRRNWFDVASYLLKFGLDVNSRDKTGSLLFAGPLSQVDTPVNLVELFLLNGLNLNLRTGQKILRDIVSQCSPPAIKELIYKYESQKH
jgi:ankyrin repeat protein